MFLGQLALWAGFGLVLAVQLVAVAPATAQQWEQRGIVLGDAEQLDAIAANGKVHVVSTKYYQLDADENVVTTETAGDPSQDLLWAFVFAPAIAVAPDGTVHVVSREEAGMGFAGGYFNIRYRRRDPSGTWSNGYIYQTPKKWNWNVGVADDGAGHVHMLASNHGGNDSVWADLLLYTDTGTSASSAGSLSNLYRVDYEARLRGGGGKVYLATGTSFTSSSAYFSHATGGSGDLASQLNANKQSLSAGSGSEKGFPDLYVDGQGSVHFTYGSGHTNHDTFPGGTSGSVQGEVHYNKFDANGAKQFASDRTIFTNLGLWHLSIGLSAVAASDDGQTVVAVALRSPNHKEAGDSDLLWAHSTDGGDTWSSPQDLGVNTFGGEGRQRPRLAAIGSKFFLFYKANSTWGYSLATIQFPDSGPAAPSGLTAVAAGSTRITVCWQDNSNNEDQFSLERKLDGSFAQVATPASGATCHEDTSATANTTYSYRVRAVAGGVYSGYSNEASATTPDVTAADAGPSIVPDAAGPGAGGDGGGLLPPAPGGSLVGCGCASAPDRTSAAIGCVLCGIVLVFGIRRRPLATRRR